MRRDYYFEAKAEHDKKIEQLKNAQAVGFIYYTEFNDEFVFHFQYEEGATRIEEGLKKSWG